MGITPAHAGNTNAGEPYEWEDEDHPRACGEYVDGEIPRKLA